MHPFLLRRRHIAVLFLFLFLLLPFSLLSGEPAVKKQSAAASHGIPLTDDEALFIENHPVIRVVCEPNWPPFEYYNTMLGVPQFSGLNMSILKAVGDKIGLEIEFIPTDNYQSSIDMIKSNKADLITGYTAKIDAPLSLMYTNGLYDIPFVLISKNGIRPPMGSTIAVPKITGDEFETLQRLFPADSYHLAIYDNPQQALESLSKGRNKYAVVNEFEFKDYTSLKESTVFPLNLHFVERFALSSYLGTSALSLFNKAYDAISEEEFDSIVYTSQLERRYMLREKANNQSNRTAFIITVFCISLLFLIITWIIIRISIHTMPHSSGIDPVTGIATFDTFKRAVYEKLKDAKPDEYYLLSIDINNFSYINDSFDYELGNALLRELAGHFVAECQKANSLITRFYADNFIIFSKNPQFLSIIEDFVYQLTNVDDHVRKFLPDQYQLVFSSGVYYIKNCSENITTMIDKANMARKLGKENFLTRRVIEYTKEMEDANELKKSITLSMNKAFEQNEFEVYYQPKFRFSNSEIIGAEALIRWNNPEKGFLQPGKFIPLFEQNGFIQKIDLFVFEKVCSFIDQWNKSGINGQCPHPLVISFNLSRFHLFNPNLMNELGIIASKYHIAPCKIEVELTETIMFDNPKRLVRIMNELKKTGYSISVDDFGSGYSSLNLLKDIPADILKLDKEFLSSATDNERESIIISSVIDMAKKLNLSTIAEGVETETQSDLLKQMGCDYVQGFLYSKPLPENDFKSLLSQFFN